MPTNDKFRPQYHFTAPQNWMNDPNGLVQWQGLYHLYYQHNPNGAFWGDMHWGHATSPDLMHWEHQPLAVFPDEEYDRYGVFSGCAIPMDDRVLFYYTGVESADGLQLPCLMTASDDLLLQPEKDDHNPLFYPPGEVKTTIFRDHALLQHDGHWMQVIGSGIEGQGGNCMLYRSDNMVDWEFVGPLVSPDDLSENEKDLYTGWECPDFMQLGEKYLLMVSHWIPEQHGPVWWYTGTFDGSRFVPEHEGPVDLGKAFYAPQSFTDDAGRRIQFGWMEEQRPVAHQIADGWSGAMSLPRELSISADGMLNIQPSSEVMAAITSGSPISATGTWQDIVAPERDLRSCVITLQLSGNAELEVLRSPDGDEVTTITFDAANGTLTLDSTRSSTNAEIEGLTFTTAVGDASSALVFVDRSIIEVFVNGHSHSVRAYPERDDATGMRICAAEGSALIVGEVRM